MCQNVVSVACAGYTGGFSPQLSTTASSRLSSCTIYTGEFGHQLSTLVRGFTNDIVPTLLTSLPVVILKITNTK